MIQPKILDIHVHLSEMSLLEVQQLRMRNFQPDLEIGREFVLQHVDDVTERLHLLARHDDGVGKHLMGRASAGTYLAPHRAVQRSTRREREYRVQQSCHLQNFPNCSLLIIFSEFFLMSYDVFNELL